jgi:hypothetical protein
MRGLLFSIFVTATFAGCAAQVVSSSARSVIVDSHTQGVDSAQRLADGECAKHGRLARLVNPPRFGSNEYLFDCVQ